MMTYPLASPDLTGNERRYILEALEEGQISSLGRFVKLFENQFATYTQNRFASATSNGTAALHLALHALGIGPGDEVIIPSLTFVATANAVRYTGAKVVLVDVESSSWCLDPALVEKAITKKTKAIIIVHLYGTPANMDRLMAISKNHKLFLIEDSAEALGGTWKSKPLGSLGHFGCFSFYGNKVLTTGEGGMVTTQSAKLDEKSRLLRDHAMSKTRRYYHPELGFNYRMTALQAAVGVGQMERALEFIKKRTQIAAWYRQNFRDMTEWSEPIPDIGGQSICWMFTLQFHHWNEKKRTIVMKRLHEKGVDSRPVFVPMSQLPMYKKKGFPVSNEISARGISLPTHVNLTERDITTICQLLKDAL